MVVPVGVFLTAVSFGSSEPRRKTLALSDTELNVGVVSGWGWGWGWGRAVGVVTPEIRAMRKLVPPMDESSRLAHSVSPWPLVMLRGPAFAGGPPDRNVDCPSGVKRMMSLLANRPIQYAPSLAKRIPNGSPPPG